MRENNGHQVMWRLRLLSATCFLRSKKVVGEKPPTTQDRLQYNVSAKAFFRLMTKVIKHIVNKMKINLDFNTVSCASVDSFQVE